MAHEYRVDGYLYDIELTWQKGQRFASANQPILVLSPIVVYP